MVGAWLAWSKYCGGRGVRWEKRATKALLAAKRWIAKA